MPYRTILSVPLKLYILLVLVNIMENTKFYRLLALYYIIIYADEKTPSHLIYIFYFAIFYMRIE